MEQLSHTTDDTLDRAEEEILTHTVSDEALEAAAGTETRATRSHWDTFHWCSYCCVVGAR
jgi:hypothetical protein